MTPEAVAYRSRYAGAAWLEDRGHKLGPFGQVVAEILGTAWLGIYHLDAAVHDKIEWGEDWVELSIRDSLATYDHDRLTILVVLAHDLGVRLEIYPRSNRTMRLVFHPRERAGGSMLAHPTIESAVDRVRKMAAPAEVAS